MGKESAEFTRLISRDLSMKVIFEPTTGKGASSAEIWNWNILGNQTAEGSEMGEGGREEGQDHWRIVNRVVMREKVERKAGARSGRAIGRSLDFILLVMKSHGNF